MKQRLIFLALFSIVGFIALQVPFTKLMGSEVNFTLFDFFGPIAGAFLGPLGIISVLGVELVNLVIKQTPLSTGSIIRLFPMLFAVWYFGAMANKKNSSPIILAIPLIAMAVFIAHPIGRTVWYYSLFWLIPVVADFRKDSLLARSLGATFTAHAVGGAAWIWAFNLPAGVWQGLIPVVAQERLVMALGIAGSYLLMQRVLTFLITRKLLPKLPSLTHVTS